EHSAYLVMHREEPTPLDRLLALVEASTDRTAGDHEARHAAMREAAFLFGLFLHTNQRVHDLERAHELTLALLTHTLPGPAPDGCGIEATSGWAAMATESATELYALEAAIAS